MTQRNTRRNAHHQRHLSLETLESREYLSANSGFAGEPSAEALELLSRINRMRTDPQGELARIFSDIDKGIANDPRISSYFGNYAYPSVETLKNEWKNLVSAPPLAWNDTLTSVAGAHTQKMISKKIQDHQFSDEASLEERLEQSGYFSTAQGEGVIYCENISAYGLEALTTGYGSVASYLHEFIAIDFGNPLHEHRDNLMNPNVTEVGIGLAHVPEGTKGFGPWVVTIDFASVTGGSSASQFGGTLIGLAYNDANANNLYDAGEGLSGMTITITQGDKTISQLTTSSAGGYQQRLDDGIYTVTISGSAFSKPITKTVVIDGQNTQLDFCPQDSTMQKPTVDLNGAASGVDYACTFDETTAAVSIVNQGMTVENAGNSLLGYASVTLKNRPDGNYEMLLVDVGGTALTSRYDSSTGRLMISGTASAADYAKVLKTLRYENTLDRPHLESRTVEVTVSNGMYESNVAQSILHLTAVHLADMSIADVKVIEGDTGTTDMVFTVHLSEAPRQSVVVTWETISGTALGGTDFIPVSNGSITIGPDETTATITVKIIGDYLAESDRSFKLNIIDAANVNLVNHEATGTILDDDNIEPLGRVTKWQKTNLDFVDGRRRLYSFEATYDGRVAWDVLPDSFPERTRMVVYIDSHDGTPIAFSGIDGAKQHVEFDVTAGTTYVIKIEGTASPELLPHIVSVKMGQTYRTTHGEFELVGDPDQPDEFGIDFSDGMRVGVNDVWSSFDPNLYQTIHLGGVMPDDILKIIGGGTDTPVKTGPDDEWIVINGVTINIAGLDKIDFYGTDGYDELVIDCPNGGSQFRFQNGNCVLVTSMKYYRVFDVEHVTVNAGGTGNVATYYDMPANDRLTLMSEYLAFEGSGYLIETKNFQSADMFTGSSGKDTAYIYGENDSLIVLNNTTANRIETSSNYRVWNADRIVAIDLDNDADNKVVVVNSQPDDYFDCSLGYVYGTNARRSVSYEISGFKDVAISTVGSNNCVVNLPPISGETTLTTTETQVIVANSEKRLTVPISSVVTFQRQLSFGSQTSLQSSGLSVQSAPLLENQRTEILNPLSAVDRLFETPLSDAKQNAGAKTGESYFFSPVDEQCLQPLVIEQLRKEKSRFATNWNDMDSDDDNMTDLAACFAKNLEKLDGLA
ncbi:MAG: CAP domain-containing protein [Planctomycetaceae bacterium]|nr:CAP domain-containing protein [Planctomycetaceae bacterium]